MTTFKSLTPAQQRQIETMPRAEAKAAMAEMTKPKPIGSTLEQPAANRQMRSDIRAAVPGATTTADALRQMSDTGGTPTAGVANAVRGLSGGVTDSPTAASNFLRTGVYSGGENQGNTNTNVQDVYQDPSIQVNKVTQNPNPMDINRIKELFGITFDPDVIEGKFNDATKAQYDNLRKEYDQTSNQFYDRLFDGQMALKDAIRSGAAQSIATGASRGMQDAREIAALRGFTEESTLGSTELAQDRANLVDKEQAAYMQNVVSAFEASEKTKQAAGTLSSMFNANDTQFGVGEMDKIARMFDATQRTEAMNYGADKGLEGTKKTVQGNIDVEGIRSDSYKNTANRNYDASVDTELIRKESQRLQDITRKEIAQIQAAATIEQARAAATQAQQSHIERMAQLTGNQSEMFKDTMGRLIGVGSVWSPEARAEFITHAGNNPIMGEHYDGLFASATRGAKSIYDTDGVIQLTDTQAATQKAQAARQKAKEDKLAEKIKKADNWTAYRDEVSSTFNNDTGAIGRFLLRVLGLSPETLPK